MRYGSPRTFFVAYFSRGASGFGVTRILVNGDVSRKVVGTFGILLMSLLKTVGCACFACQETWRTSWEQETTAVREGYEITTGVLSFVL